MSRSGIKDEEGAEVAKILYNNRTLRKLELEGNLLGAKTAMQFGKVLKLNNTLLALDLENNCLTQDGEDNAGMVEFIRALETN